MNDKYPASSGLAFKAPKAPAATKAKTTADPRNIVDQRQQLLPVGHSDDSIG
jgi:hypothetical protein